MSHEHRSTEQQKTTLEQASDPELEKAAETLDAIEDHVKETNPNATPEDVDETVAGFVDAADQTNDEVVESDAANVGVVEMENNPSAWHTALAFVKLPIEKVANVLRKLSPEKADEVTATIDAAEHDIADNRQVESEPVLESSLDQSPHNAAQYVNEVLKKDMESRDTTELIRPTYQISGRSVVFRNRMELVDFKDKQVTIVGASDIGPLQLPADIKGGLQKREAIAKFNAEHSDDSPENTLTITNTPLGMVEAAIVLGNQDLKIIQDKLKAEQYADPDCQDVMDSILGAISVGEDGQPLEYYNLDGYAVALAALSGDKNASRIIDTKRSALRSIERDRITQRADMMKVWAEEKRQKENWPEAMPVDKLFLVHSTTHEIEFDEKGDAVFRPAGQYADTACVPRTSWHATLNSNVYPHAQAEDRWGANNRIVIASLGETMQATGDRLDSLDGVDSWFVVGPGEQVKLPSPVVIEPITEGNDLLITEGNVIKILTKPSYSPEEQDKIRNLIERYHPGSYVGDRSRQYDAATLREACVQMVLQEKGVNADERDHPSQSGHGMDSHDIARRICLTAAELGVGTGTHFNNSISKAEQQSWARVLTATEQVKSIYYREGHADETYAQSIPLAARRQALVNGCIQAVADTAIEREDADDFM